MKLALTSFLLLASYTVNAQQTKSSYRSHQLPECIVVYKQNSSWINENMILSKYLKEFHPADKNFVTHSTYEYKIKSKQEREMIINAMISENASIHRYPSLILNVSYQGVRVNAEGGGYDDRNVTLQIHGERDGEGASIFCTFPESPSFNSGIIRR